MVTAEHQAWHGEIANGHGVRCPVCPFFTRALDAQQAEAIAADHAEHPTKSAAGYESFAHHDSHRRKGEKRCTCAMNPVNEALFRPCPECGAAAKQRCRASQTGWVLADPHAARVGLVTD